MWSKIGTKNQRIEEHTIAQLVVLRAMRVKDKVYALYQVVDEFDFEKIANDKSSKKASDILEKDYKGDNRVKQVRF